jgi:hypothetical protein
MQPLKSSPPAKRVIVRVELLPEAKNSLNAMTRRTGQTKVAALSRTIEWLGRQPEEIRMEVLGLYPQNIRREIGQLIAERMKDGKS